jgi:hypothetical protein
MFEDLTEVKPLMRDQNTMKGRKLLVRLHDEKVEPLREDGLYIRGNCDYHEMDKE